MIEFRYHDGGRAAAGFRGSTGDCVTRAIAIATGELYREVYDELTRRMKADRAYVRKLELVYGGRARDHATPRTGVPRRAYEGYLTDLGWEWIAVSRIGSGCLMHLDEDEVPGGALVVRLSKHMAAVVDGVLYDTADCSRSGTRCVYGYFRRRDV